jgi:hypothetical protein
MLGRRRSSSAGWLANAAIAAVITVAFANVGLTTRWRLASEEFRRRVSHHLLHQPGLRAGAPRITPPVFAPFSFPVNWLIVIAVMLFLAAGGSLFALGILASVGYHSKPAKS